MNDEENAVSERAAQAALVFGKLIRNRRKAAGMRQDQLALATGVGRRFLIELEAGKSSCQLGRSLLVGRALGITPSDGVPADGQPQITAAAELPDLPDEEDPHGRTAGLF
jgi:transcriptional regulator with XRE-family HTH domain